MRRICEQLVDVVGAEGQVPFAQDDAFAVGEFRGLGQAAMDAAAVAGLMFVIGNRAGLLSAGEGRVAAVVADDDDSADERVREEVGDGGADAVLVVVGGERDRDAGIRQRPVSHRHIGALAIEEQQEIGER